MGLFAARRGSPLHMLGETSREIAHYFTFVGYGAPVTARRNPIDYVVRYLKDRSRYRDFYFGVILLLFCLTTIFWLIPAQVSIGYLAHGTVVGPSFFPYAMCLTLLFLSILLIHISPETSQYITRAEDKVVSRIVIVLIIILFATYYIIPLIGMVPAGILAMFVLMQIFGFPKWYLSLGFSSLFVILLFLFLEKLAQVRIPRGILFDGLY